MAPSLTLPCDNLSSSFKNDQPESMPLSAYLGSSCSPTAEDKAREVQESELEFLTALEGLHSIEFDTKEEDPTEDSEQKNHLKRCWRFRHCLAKENYKLTLWQQEYEPVLQRRWVETQSTLKMEHDSQIEGDQCEMAHAGNHPLQSFSHGPKRFPRMSPSTLHSPDSYAAILKGYHNTSRSQIHDPKVSATPVETLITPSHRLLEETDETYSSQHNEELLEIVNFLPFMDEQEQKISTHSAHLNSLLESAAVLRSRMDHNVFLVDRNLAAIYKSMTTIAQLRTSAAEDLLVVVKMRREHVAFRASWANGRTLLDSQFTEAQAANEAILSSAAELLVEAAGLHIETDQIRASAEAELDAVSRLRAETAHRAAPQGETNSRLQHRDG